MNSAGYALWTTGIRGWLDSLERGQSSHLNLTLHLKLNHLEKS